MRILPYVLLAAAPLAIVACVSQDDSEDLGSIADGKSDAPAIQNKAITVNKRSSATKPGVKNYTVRSTVDFTVSLVQTESGSSLITVTNADTNEAVSSEKMKNPTVTVTAPDGEEHEYKIRIENWDAATLHAKLSATGNQAVSPALLAAARANLDRVAKEIDFSHLDNYGLSGSLTDKFMTALSAEYERQHPDQYIARVKALASMAFFALPDVLPPAEGTKTPFHGLDMDQFDALMSIEDSVYNQLVANNNNDTNGVRPFSVCETKFMIETYVRPHATFPGFDAYKTAYTTYAESCAQKDKDEWYNFRGLGGLRPSWVESNLADRFLRRMAKNCQSPSAAWTDECKAWDTDRLGYRQLRNRQLAASSMYYAPADEDYVTDPNNPLVWLEDRDGDNIGETLRPGPATLKTGQTGTLQVNSTGEFTGSLKFQQGTAAAATVTPAKLQAHTEVMPGWDKSYLARPDMGLLKMFASQNGTGCTTDILDPSACPLMKRFYSLIDRHENFYKTYSALSPDYYGVSSQPSPLVACSITLAASHQWDSAGTPQGGSAGFIFLMRIPFKEIVTGNDRSVSTIMPGPKTTSIQSLYTTGGGSLDMTKVWLDVASLSNNQYATEHEISAFGAVRAEEIEGILVVRKPAAVQ